MTTKEQERKALEQIKKIIDSMGEDSYIGKAFEGCIDDAEDNINDDFWNSYKDRYEKADRDAWEAQGKAKEYKDAYEELKVNHQIALDQVKQSRDRENMLNEKYIEEYDRAHDLEDKVKELEDTIVNLKAKLYDLMTA